MTRSFSRDELAEAFARWLDRVERANASNDWDEFIDHFTEDGEYLEQMAGSLVGHDAIRGFVEPILATFPGNAMSFPNQWLAVDEVTNTIVVKTRNVMRDPGDGTVFECPNLTVLHYAGEDRWAFQEDVYDPQVFITMIAEWGRHAHGLGSLTDDEVAWFAANNPTALEA